MGRLPPSTKGEGRVGEVSGSSIHPGQAGPCFARSHLWTEELEKTQSQGAAFKKALKAKETGPVPRAKVTRGQRSLLLQETAQAEEKSVFWQVGQAKLRPHHGVQATPHKLSLLDVVLAPSSVSREQSCRSQFSGAPSSPPSIQGWAAIWSSEGLSEGRRDRHHSMSCWHSAGERRASGRLSSRPLPSKRRPLPSKRRSYTPGETLLRKNRRPRRISSSCSKGMSPHTMS